MKKYRKIGAVACILTVFTLAGCGGGNVPDVVSEASIVIAENGTVTSYLVETFDKEFYNISELASMAITEAAEYNAEKQTDATPLVTVDKVEALEDGSGKVAVVYKYNNAESFMDYNDSVLFYGTVQEAVNAGYDLETVKSVNDGTALSGEEWMQKAEKHLIITQEKVKLYCPQKVTHVSEGAVVEADGSVDASQVRDVVVVLLKK